MTAQKKKAAARAGEVTPINRRIRPAGSLPGAPMELPLNVHDFPDPGKDAPLPTQGNLKHMLDQYGVKVVYNLISKEVEILIPHADFTPENRSEASYGKIIDLCARNRMPTGNVPVYITALADSNRYNPVAEWIDSKPWDGVDRLEPLADTLDAADRDLTRLLLRRWLVGAVRCVYEEKGFSMQGVLVLQGAQGLGKTTWIMGMAGEHQEWVAESVILDPSNKDSVKQFVSYWLVELGELEATFSKSDITALRGFITRKMDELRLPYAKTSSKFPRRTAALASVNEHAYLRDETGNRRYWTVRCGPNLNGLHGIDMQQLWSQAKALYLAGEQHTLSREESARLNASNLDHTERNPLEDLIMSRFAWDSPSTERMSAADVCIAVGYDKPTQKQAKDVAVILRRLTGNEPKKSHGRMVFEMPRRARASDDENGRAF
ncbi:virulence-associated E family protein [Paraburkholderia tropica]|uniref:virulence-associated E family protein n=1 Tax=Paraburkholderia tropica TaxID=92647 RepID=UPI001CC7C32C|nr:virulence-associated E family protein [Paraburkholderia tropica]